MLQTLHELSPLSGRTALITGASRGIGSAIAFKLASLGCNVAIHYRVNHHSAKEIARQCEEVYGVQTFLIQADLSEAEEIEKLLENTRLYLNSPTLLINNAGLALQKTLLDTTSAQWKHIMSVNLDAAFYLSKGVLPFMISEGFGRIISISSVFGMIGGSCEVAYSASKGALLAFTKALAKEVGRAGITVNAVAPGPIETDMLSDFTDSELQELKEDSPVGRLGTPQDVAECVGFLTLPTSSYLTGQILSPNGGWVT